MSGICATSFLLHAAVLRPAWEGETVAEQNDCAAADQAFASSKWGPARDLYTKCIASNPDNFEALSNLGIVLSRLGLMREAIASYQKALTLSPDNAKIEFNLAIAFIKAGDYDAAAGQLTQLQKNAPDTRYEELLAFCYYHLGYYSLAARSAERVYEVQPDDPSNALILGSAYTRLGMYEKALPLITLALKAAGSAEGHLIMADTLIGLHHYPQAMDELKQSAAAQPDLPGLHSSIGMVEVGLNKPDAAKLEFSKELSEDPNDYQANYFMGRLTRLDGDLMTAKKYLTVADRLRPNSPEVMFEFACIDVSERNYVEAIPLLEKVIKQEPDHTKAYLLLSESYQKTGRKEEAQKEGELYNKIQRQIQDHKASEK
jgi:tetratricopeptide (TPR) repeat protein